MISNATANPRPTLPRKEMLKLFDILDGQPINDHRGRSADCFSTKGNS